MRRPGQTSRAPEKPGQAAHRPQSSHLWNGDHSFTQEVWRACVVPGTVPGVRHHYGILIAVELTV